MTVTIREFYIERRRAETPLFLNVLKALPADRLGYRPHDRSPSAEQLVWTLTSELRLTEIISKMDEASWNRVAQFYYNGRVVSEQPVGQFLWFIVFDAIHHRGQLSVYLRPMGGAVPAIYGPSADSRAA
jgi:uncharacterized damage-inducible protein DinB